MMTEKRFILAEDSNGLFSIFDNEDLEDEPLIYGARFGTEKIVDLLNTQQATIELYKRSVDKREEQISIIKNHCLKFLTNEQIETIRRALEDE